MLHSQSPRYPDKEHRNVNQTFYNMQLSLCYMYLYFFLENLGLKKKALFSFERVETECPAAHCHNLKFAKPSYQQNLISVHKLTNTPSSHPNLITFPFFCRCGSALSSCSLWNRNMPSNRLQIWKMESI
jgi:hypothetical protein